MKHNGDKTRTRRINLHQRRWTASRGDGKHADARKPAHNPIAQPLMHKVHIYITLATLTNSISVGLGHEEWFIYIIVIAALYALLERVIWKVLSIVEPVGSDKSVFQGPL